MTFYNADPFAHQVKNTSVVSMRYLNSQIHREESRRVVVKGRGTGSGEVVSNGNRVSVWEDQSSGDQRW